MNGPAPSASPRELLAAMAVGVFMVVQTAIPLAHLPLRYDSPFAWKMFAYYRAAPVAFRLVFEDGRTQLWSTMSDRRRVAQTLRFEVDRTRVMPSALCARVPGVTAVEWQTPGEPSWNRMPCPSRR